MIWEFNKFDKENSMHFSPSFWICMRDLHSIMSEIIYKCLLYYLKKKLAHWIEYYEWCLLTLLKQVKLKCQQPYSIHFKLQLLQLKYS